MSELFPSFDAMVAWTERITLSWRSSVTAIIETGRLVTEAKAVLPHGTFERMICRELPFKPSTARRLIKIAADERLTNRAHVHALPPHWGTLYELTKLPDDVFGARILDGTIHAGMERRDVAKVVKHERRVAREIELAANLTALPAKRYGVILADPEWRFESWSCATGMDRAAANHYPTSATETIATRPIQKIAAADCVLFLWATAPMLPQALYVMERWGFAYRSQVVWAKDRVGTGYWFRNRHELLLVGIKGDVPAPAPGMQWDSLLMAPCGEHSAKPEVFLELIEEYFPHVPKIELNRRGPARPGWAAWGNEATDPLDIPSFLRRTEVTSPPTKA